MRLGPCHAHVAGFDLPAGLVTRAGQRDRLERLAVSGRVDAANVWARCPGVSALRGRLRLVALIVPPSVVQRIATPRPAHGGVRDTPGSGAAPRTVVFPHESPDHSGMARRMLGNVSRACRIMGYKRDSCYRFQEMYETGRGVRVANDLATRDLTVSPRYRTALSE
jgi:hypothetical protein